MKNMRKAAVLFTAAAAFMAVPQIVFASETETQEHHYQLQEDSYEATDTEGGYRHYICADCGDEYSYEMDPMVYEVNPKTGEAIEENGKSNPILPEWEHIPDGEPQVFWSREDNEWRVYLYGSHDAEGKGYCGQDYVLWSAPVYDMSDWRNDGVILEITDANPYGGANLYAPDCDYDVTTDTYYLIANQMYGNSVLRAADNPAGPWDETEAVWTIETSYCYDPSIYIEDGTIYIAGSCMYKAFKNYPEVVEAVDADEYTSGMGEIGVIFQLKEDLSDGDGIEAISWMPNDERSYLPIFEGPSLTGYVDDLGVYVFLYVSYDVGPDDIFYNSTISYVWTDDLMNGTWHYGENNVDEIYTDTGVLLSGNHGNTISDTSGRYVRNTETGEMEFTDFPTYVCGNNHGGMAKINGQWYFFGHRQTNSHAYSRQAIAGTIEVYTENDTPVIEPMEYTSSGLLDSLDAYETMKANIACWITEAIDHPAPDVEEYNVHKDCLENTPYITATRDENSEHESYITNLKDANVVGYKYLDFGETEQSVALKLLVSQQSDYADGTVDVYLDAPDEEQGGTKIGTLNISAADIEAAAETETSTSGTTWSWLSQSMDTPVSGVHGVYFVFHSDSDSYICAVDEFAFAAE